MGYTLKHFLITFFAMTLWIFVFINFLGWSGLAPSMAIGIDGNNWGSDKYFGYSSFMAMVNAFNKAQDNATIFSGAQIFDTLKHLASVILGNIPQLVGSIQNYINTFQNGTFVEILFGGFNVSFNIIQLFLQPIAFGLWSLYLVIQVIGLAVEVLVVFFQAIGGVYNYSFPDISGGIDWSQYFIWTI